VKGRLVLSPLPYLVSLNIANDDFASLDVTRNAALKSLNVRANELAALDSIIPAAMTAMTVPPTRRARAGFEKDEKSRGDGEGSGRFFCPGPKLRRNRAAGGRLLPAGALA
jgi:hypothetical protein